MNKIIKIQNDLVLIGTDNGGIEEVPSYSLSFEPHIGDEVEIYKTDTQMIVSKKEREMIQPQNPFPAGGNININVANSNSNTNTIQQGPAPYGKPVNKVLYCVLALLFGGLGIHKFYAGKIGMGILYLVFSWTLIPSFVGFIEFILGLCKRSDANGLIYL